MDDGLRSGVAGLDQDGPVVLKTLLDFATYDAKKTGFAKVVYIIRKDIEKDFRSRLFDRIAKNFNDYA